MRQPRFPLPLSLTSLCAALALCVLPACTDDTRTGEDAAAGSTGTLRLTGIPNENTTELAERMRPLEAHLGQELGVRVEYVPMTDYAGSVEAFKNGDVHLAWFGGLTGVQARRAVPGARVIAMGAVDGDYKSYFVANPQTGIERSESFPLELASTKFAFGSASSTSGRMMPEHFIREATGKSPAEFFGAEMNFTGSHDKTAKLVEAGTFGAGALDYKTYERMVREGQLDPARCRIVWETPGYVDYNFTVRPDLDALLGAGFTDRLQQRLLAIRDPRLLDALNRPEGLVAASNADFQLLEQLALSLQLVR